MDQHVRSVKMEVRFHQLWIITLYLYIHASSFMYTGGYSAEGIFKKIISVFCFQFISSILCPLKTPLTDKRPAPIV